MRSKTEGNPVSRRIALQHQLVDTAGIVAAPIVFTLAKTLDRSKPEPIPEPTTPNLGLSINAAEFNRVIATGSKYEVIGTSTTSLTCPTWAPKVCMGSNSPDLKLAVNKPLTEFMIKQAGMDNPPIPTTIFFTNDFPDKDQNQQGEQGGFTRLEERYTKQTIVIWLKLAAWFAFNYLEGNNLDPQDYFNGTLSLFVSEEFVHEMGHAGKELKMQARNGFTVSEETLDRVHPQIYEFQNQYTNLYKNLPEERKRHAVLVGLEAQLPIAEYRRRIMQEAAQRGFKWEPT